jgi:CRP-like cAMP-binding protein
MTYDPSQETLALLGKTNIFRDLNPAQLKEILSSAHRFQVERRSFLFHQGEPANSFYVLLEGNARLTQITPEGRQVILHYFGPGDVMAVIVVLANAEYPASAEATTDCVVLSWDREEAIRHLEQYPHLAIKGMEMVAGRFWELQNRYLELATQRVERRVAHALLRLTRQGNGRDSQQPSPTLSLSRQDLAEMTGTTLFTVSRICSQWEQQGILDSGREQITLLQPEELTAIAEDLPISDKLT